jgi:hypothetical protein
LYTKFLPRLESKGMKVIEFKEFHSALCSLLDYVECKYPQVFENATPSINKTALVNAHRGLNLESRLSVLSRSGLHTERAWYIDSLNYLIQAGEY